MSADSEDYNPFRLTKEEIASLDPNYKKPKKRKVRRKLGSSSSEDGGSNSEMSSRQSRLHYIATQSSKMKKRALENVYDLFSDLESEEDDETGTGNTRSEEPSKAGGGDEDNPTYEMATVRRFIIGKEPVSKFVENSRKMFLLKYSLTVKNDESKRLESEVRQEEQALQRMESELRLAEQAFDQFLQENDRKAIAAMKSAELETRLRLEKAGALKQVDNRIIALKRDINKLKDVLVEYGTYERFLYSMSPSAWRQLTSEEASEQTGAISTLKSLLTGSKSSKKESTMSTLSTASSKKSAAKWKLSSVVSSAQPRSSRGSSTSDDADADKEASLLKTLIDHLNMSKSEFSKVKAVPMLYFQKPKQLLSIFTDLEDENLKLIQECREAEGNLEKIRTSVRETRTRLNQQGANFQQEIRKVTDKIVKERESEAKLIELQEERERGDEMAAEAKRAEDKILRELGRLVRSTYVECLGPLDQEVTTMDLLKRIELRMEFLTQHLERLPQEKVKIAQRTCERERRQREHEAKMERQRQIEADRNKKALDRALAPPWVKPSLRTHQGYNPASFEAWLQRRKYGKRGRMAQRDSDSDDSDD